MIDTDLRVKIVFLSSSSGCYFVKWVGFMSSWVRFMSSWVRFMSSLKTIVELKQSGFVGIMGSEDSNTPHIAVI